MIDHPHRIVALQGASNFRDLGGYAGHGGRTVGWGRVYRSDHLGSLTAQDTALLAARGVTRALDFRGVHESAAAPYQWAGIRRHALSIEPTVAQAMQELVNLGANLDEATAASLMEDLYRHIVRRQQNRLAEFFGHLLDSDAPLVFHCTAGKDRTGVAAALLLHVLGVAPQVIEQDFLLTNRVFRPPPGNQTAIPAEARQALWSVRPSYLQAALHVISQEFGGITTYLQRQLGLSPAAQRQLADRLLSAN